MDKAYKYDDIPFEHRLFNIMCIDLPASTANKIRKHVGEFLRAIDKKI